MSTVETSVLCIAQCIVQGNSYMIIVMYKNLHVSFFFLSIKIELCHLNTELHFSYKKPQPSQCFIK